MSFVKSIAAKFLHLALSITLGLLLAAGITLAVNQPVGG